MPDHVVHQSSGDKLAKDSKHNLGGPGPDQGVHEDKFDSKNSQPEAEHGKDQSKKVGREQYQDLQENNKQK